MGHSSGGRTEILEGLKGGERVVVSGQFLIDSEASLSGALERLDAKPDGMKEQP
jgi:Cu(I)/Ag(I) efflux system membrane fusion protein